MLLDEGGAGLTERHWAEIALDQDKVPLDIDWDALLFEEAHGRFKVFAARRDGVLIGYISFKLFRPERYRSTLYVNEDVFWLDPEERRGLTGYRMLKAAVEALPRPCKLQMKEKLGFKGGRVALIMERLGLEPVEMVYGKYLE